MNKWFETNNLASYAKTALAQAQKKIDQVLDIKEEEIINSGAASSSSSNIKQTLESRSTSSISGGAKSGAADDALADEGDSFFSTFLNQTAPSLSSNLTAATSTLLAKNSSSNLLNLSPASSLISATDSENTLKAPATVNPEDLENTSTSATSSTATLDGLRPQRSKNQGKKNKNAGATRHQSQSEMNEQIEKQNWIQSYVDSSIETIDKSSSVLVESKANVNTSLVTAPELSSPSSDGYGQINLSDENSQSEKSQQKNAQSFSEIDFIKIDGNGSSASSASIEEGPETCASSDIEVISLPSTHGDQRSFKASKVPSLASMASKQTNKLKNPTLTSQQEQQKMKNNIKLVKSPPPPQSNDPNDSNNSQSNNISSKIHSLC